MPAVQSAASSEVPSLPFPQARWFTPSNISLLTADHGPRAEATKHHPEAPQVPEQLTRARQQPQPRGQGRCAAPGGAGTPEGRCAGGGAAARFHPSARRFPAWAPALARSPSFARDTGSARRKGYRAQQGHVRPLQKATHAHTQPGHGEALRGEGVPPPGYLDGASQRGGGRAPHQLAEELRPPAAARRLPAGGRGPDAGCRRQVEVGRVEAEPRPAGGAGARLRGAEGEERRQQRPERRGARRRGHPAPGSARGAPVPHCRGGGRRERGRRRNGR